MTEENRISIFISHAAPEDNDFTSWLSLQLIGLGYDVWSDVIVLKGGEDWWKIIENQIREKSIKFLLVLSEASNQKDGVLKELAIAQKVVKKLNTSNFIIPLHLDTNLSYDDVNIELNRFNSINFKSSWSDGLKVLIERLDEDNVPKTNSNYNQVKQLWENIFLRDKKAIQKQESYVSNWFPILELPETINFHKFKYAIPNGYDIRTLPFPAVLHKNHLVTFAWCYDFMEEFPRTKTYDPSHTTKVRTEEILNGEYDNNFIRNREAKRLIVRLLNSAFDKTLSHKNVEAYPMSNKVSFWIKKGVLEKDKFEKVQLVGKQKEKNWHFGISGTVKLFPERCFVFYTHIWFTTNGETLIPEASNSILLEGNKEKIGGIMIGEKRH